MYSQALFIAIATLFALQAGASPVDTAESQRTPLEVRTEGSDQCAAGEVKCKPNAISVITMFTKKDLCERTCGAGWFCTHTTIPSSDNVCVFKGVDYESGPPATD